MIVVSDTSPLNYLILAGEAHLLPALFSRVVVPSGVVAEMLQDGTPAPVRAWMSAIPDWLEVKVPASVDTSLPLDRGEAEAISLAVELRADILLVDERKATGIARQLGFAVTGTLGVLALAAEQRMVNFAEAINALRRTSFRCSQQLYDELLQRYASDTEQGSGDR